MYRNIHRMTYYLLDSDALRKEFVILTLGNIT